MPAHSPGLEVAGTRFRAEVAGLLQAVELVFQVLVQRRAVSLADDGDESIGCNGPTTWVRNDRSYYPREAFRPVLSALADCEEALLDQVLDIAQVVNERSSVQIEAVLGC